MCIEPEHFLRFISGLLGFILGVLGTLFMIKGPHA